MAKGKGGRPKHDENAVANRFSSAEEKKIANTLQEKYLKEFSIENISDKNTLADMIYFEVIQVRLQKKLNDYYSKDAQAIPIDLVKLYDQNSRSIINMKDSLGLGNTKDKLDNYDALQHLFKRHQVWREENQLSRFLKCPHCFQVIWLKMRTEAWEALKHPFFKDTFLYNVPLFENFGKTVKLTRDFLASVFGVSPDCIDLIIERRKTPSKIEEVKEIPEEINGITEETERPVNGEENQKIEEEQKDGPEEVEKSLQPVEIEVEIKEIG